MILGQILLESARVFADLAPWLLGGLIVAGLLAEVLPAAFVERSLGRRGPGSVLRAMLIGIPLPLCSCSVLPTAVALARKGARSPALVAFLVATPEIGADSIAITWSLMGPGLAVVRPLAAAVTALVAGFVEMAFGRRGAAPLPASPETPARPMAPGTSLGVRVLVRGFHDLLDDIALPILAGCLVSGVITAVLPPAAVESWIGSSPAVHMLVMLGAGLPLYVCASASTPIAAAFIAKGVAPGAVLVFLLVGPATNLSTLVALRRLLGTGTALRYVASIAGASLLLGALVEAGRGSFAAGLFPPAPAVAARPPAPSIPEGVAAGLLAIAMARVLLLRWFRRNPADPPSSGAGSRRA